MTIELREQFPTMTDIRQLEHVGFSRDQIAGHFRVKALYQQGAYHEANPEHKRQAFVRWLYCRVACKANPWSRRRCEGGWGVGDARDPRSSTFCLN